MNKYIEARISLDKLNITTKTKVEHKAKLGEVFAIMDIIRDLNFHFRNYYWYEEYKLLIDCYKSSTKKELDLALKMFKIHLNDDLNDFIYRLKEVV